MEQPKTPPKKPKILEIDIETSFNIARVWGKWEQNVLGDFIKERALICFAWKWFGEAKVNFMSFPKNGYDEMVAKLYDLYTEADYVVGHNVLDFDTKMINTEFLLAGYEPPKRVRSYDTLKIARKYFRLNSNKLNDIGKRLGVGQKAHTGGFDLWVKCMEGDKKAWATMEAYNKMDVVLLDKVFKLLKPWEDRPKLKRIR